MSISIPVVPINKRAISFPIGSPSTASFLNEQRIVAAHLRPLLFLPTPTENTDGSQSTSLKERFDEQRLRDFSVQMAGKAAIPVVDAKRETLLIHCLEQKEITRCSELVCQILQQECKTPEKTENSVHIDCDSERYKDFFSKVFKATKIRLKNIEDKEKCKKVIQLVITNCFNLHPEGYQKIHYLL